MHRRPFPRPGAVAATILLLTLLTTASGRADELRLANGDRISGRVVSLAGGTLTVATPHGELRIPWSTITAIAVDEPILVTIGDADPVSSTIALSAVEGQATFTPGGTLPLTTIAALARPAPATTIDGSASVGLVGADGNTEVTSLRLDGDIIVRRGGHRYATTAALNRTHDGGIPTARNWNVGTNYDRFVSARFFLNSNAIFTADPLRDLDLRTALGAGVGLQVLTGPVARLTANGGIGWVHENLLDGNHNQYSAAKESATLDITIVRDRLTLFHQHDGYFGLTGNDNLFVRAHNGIRLLLVGGLVTTLQHDMDFDRSPAPGRHQTDRTLALTFGYRF